MKLARIKWLVSIYELLSSCYFEMNKDDIWIGIFIDRKKGVFYFVPIPTVTFRFIYDKNKWIDYFNKSFVKFAEMNDRVIAAMKNLGFSTGRLGMALSGIIKTFHIDDGGNKIIDKFEFTGASLVPKENLIDPHCVIKTITDAEKRKQP